MGRINNIILPAMAIATPKGMAVLATIPAITYWTAPQITSGSYTVGVSFLVLLQEP
jgi:hypothetical protein